MDQLSLGAEVRRSEVPDGQGIWSARWCFRGKASAARPRYVVRQIRRAVIQAFAGTPHLESVPVLTAVALHMGVRADLRRFHRCTHVHQDDELGTCVESQQTFEIGTKHRVETSASIVWPPRSSASIPTKPCVDLRLSFSRSPAEPSLSNQSSGARVAIHFGDLLACGPRDAISGSECHKFTSQHDTGGLNKTVVGASKYSCIEGLRREAEIANCRPVTTVGLATGISSEAPTIDADRDHLHRAA